MFKKKNKLNSKSGFALLYVMLFIFLILVTVVITWATSMAENRLNQRTEGGAEAYQLAQAAIDDGWNDYHLKISSTDPLPSETYPDEACKATSPKVYRVYQNKNPEAVALGAPVTFAESLVGFYAYRYCTDNTSLKTTIEGIGYYKGSKITLKSDVKHDDEETCVGVLPNPVVCTLSHIKDNLLIYQTGPSGN